LVTYRYRNFRALHSFPTRRSSDLKNGFCRIVAGCVISCFLPSRRTVTFDLPRNSNNAFVAGSSGKPRSALILLWVVSLAPKRPRSEEHTSELQSRGHLVCRLLLEK